MIFVNTSLFDTSLDRGEESPRKHEMFFVDEKSVVPLQSEVAQSCLLAADLTSLTHSHEVNTEGHSITLIQNFLWTFQQI